MIKKEDQNKAIYSILAISLAIGVIIFFSGGEFPGLDITLQPNQRIHTLEYPNIGIAIRAPEDNLGAQGTFLSGQDYFFLSLSDNRWYTHKTTKIGQSPILRFEYNVSELARLDVPESEKELPLWEIEEIQIVVEGYGKHKGDGGLKLYVWHDTKQNWYIPIAKGDYTHHKEIEDRYLYYTLTRNDLIQHMTRGGVLRSAVVGPEDKDNVEVSEINIDQIYIKMTYTDETKESPPPVIPPPSDPIDDNDTDDDYEPKPPTNGVDDKDDNGEITPPSDEPIEPPKEPPKSRIDTALLGILGMVAVIVGLIVVIINEGSKNAKHKKSKGKK